MNDTVLKKTLAVIKKIYRQTDDPVTLRDIGHNGIVFCGKKLTAEERRIAVEVLVGNKSIMQTSKAGNTAHGYIPAPEFNISTEIVDGLREELTNIRYFDHDPSDEDLLRFVKNAVHSAAIWFLKTHVLTREGAIARQLVERIHFAFHVIHTNTPVKKKYALSADQNAIVPSTLPERTAMLEDLAANGFIRITGNNIVPVTPYPSWEIYKRKGF